ncbi:MAG: sodium:solute symporter family protein [Opitutaceae bacterium]|nr:sodium:solute symporter family protein [Opitutaceae bacterium]
MNLPIMIIGVYLVAVTVVGTLLTRKSASSEDWAVAGGGMGIIMVAVGVAGTRIGGAGTYGVAGNVISGGIWNMWWYGINTFLAMAIVGLFFAKPYRRTRLQTVGELFTLRFGTRRCQAMTSVCVQIEYLIVNIIEAYVIAVVLRGVVGLPMEYGVFIAAFVLVTYISLGGLWGTAVTNLIHCGVILIGLGLIGFMGINQMGGWTEVTSSIDGFINTSEKDLGHFWNFTGMGWGAVLGMFFSAAVHTPAASVYTNYSTAAKKEKNLLPSFLLAGIIGGLMPILAGLIGLLTVARYGLEPGTSGYTNLTKLATEISPLVGGIALAAVLAAVISSGGPILLSSSTMFVRDWLTFTREWSPNRRLKAYRFTTAIYGLIAAICALLVSKLDSVSILDMLLFGFAMVVPPAVAIGYLIYWKRTTEKAALWGMMTGLGAGLAWFVAIKIALGTGIELSEESSVMYRLAYNCFAIDGKGIDPSYATTFVPLIVIPIVSFLTKEISAGKERFYSIVSGKTIME